MDVRPQTPRFPLPTLHNLHPHAGAILSRLPGALFSPAIPTPVRLHIESTQYTYPLRFRALTTSNRLEKASYDEDVLFHAHWALRHGDGP
jgi:hypothetical protein